MREPITISFSGGSALLLQSNSSRFDEQFQKRIWSLASDLQAAPGFTETVPGMNNILALFNPDEIAPEEARRDLSERWAKAQPLPRRGKTVEIPVVYGGQMAEDFKPWARHCGLAPLEAAQRHAAGTYQVAAIGAMPGFPYLSGLDPALAIARRSTPRLAVQAGSVIVGGAQAAVMPQTSPSGWHIIGHTKIALFDPHRDEPSTLAPGDIVRFTIEDVWL
ncbi:MAG TPA: 5-oxoprolinase subunit PxpB [Ensifer sp.]|nr:5-oxoprolinase subunit PxpB [Ensifer sp.]